MTRVHLILEPTSLDQAERAPYRQECDVAGLVHVVQVLLLTRQLRWGLIPQVLAEVDVIPHEMIVVNVVSIA